MSAPPQPGVRDLALRLERVLEELSAESRFHLETALAAVDTPGVGGTLLIQVPRREREHALVRWAGGTQQLSLPI